MSLLTLPLHLITEVLETTWIFTIWAFGEKNYDPYIIDYMQHIYLYMYTSVCIHVSR